MITVSISGEDGKFRAESVGHALYNPGNDIVCSAVSCLMYTLAGAIENMTETGSKDIVRDAGNTIVAFEGGDEHDNDVAEVLFMFVAIGLVQMQKQYPDHLTVNIS